MSTFASRILDNFPTDIAALPSGEVLVLSWSREGLHLDSYDADFAEVWHLALGDDALGLSVDQRGVPWIVDRRGVSALTGGGDVWHRVSFVPPDGMDVSAFTTVDEDIVFACQHADGMKACEPLLARVAADGTVRWLSTLSSDLMDFESEPPAVGDTGRPQVPEDWVNGYLGAGKLTVSGDALFAPYTEVSRSPLGLGYVIDVADGSLRYTAGVMACGEVTAMNDGEFLVGCGGETTLYDWEGRRKAQWNTNGIHVVRPGDIRVLEISPGGVSQSRIARLLPDGSVVRGDLVDGRHTSRPYIQDNGTIIFVRNGLLTKVRDLAIVKRAVIDPWGEHDITSPRVLPVADGLVTTYSRHLRNARGERDPMRCISGLVRIQF
jgi:hypothetical protein